MRLDPNVLYPNVLRQGNCVYRDIYGGAAEHAAILYGYNGGNVLADLQADNKYIVAEHDGAGGDTVTNNYGNWSTWIDGDGAYCPANLTRADRETILENCYYLVQTNISYCITDVLYWQGTNWDGILSDIAELRCDGFVEAAYEDVPVRLYGGDAWWNIMDIGGGSGTSLYKHNNNIESTWALTPERVSGQRRGAEIFCYQKLTIVARMI